MIFVIYTVFFVERWLKLKVYYSNEETF